MRWRGGGGCCRLFVAPGLARDRQHGDDQRPSCRLRGGRASRRRGAFGSVQDELRRRIGGAARFAFAFGDTTMVVHGSGKRVRSGSDLTMPMKIILIKFTWVVTMRASGDGEHLPVAHGNCQQSGIRAFEADVSAWNRAVRRAMWQGTSHGCIGWSRQAMAGTS